MPFQKALLRLKSPKLSSNALLINPINRRGPFAEGFRAAKAEGKGLAAPAHPRCSPARGQGSRLLTTRSLAAVPRCQAPETARKPKVLPVSFLGGFGFI